MQGKPWLAGLATVLATALASLPGTVMARMTPLVGLKASTKPCNHPFFPATSYLSNMNVTSPVLGDFNGDGIPDLATVTWQFNGQCQGKSYCPYGWVGSLTILIGNKNGTFRQGGTFAGAEGRLAVGDFNGDGKLDVASTNSAGAVDIFLGNGDGTFQPAKGYPANVSTDFIAVGDFNHDGKLDIAAGGYGYGVVQILIGNGDGTFRSPVNYGVGLWPSSIAVADFNGDGYLDVAVANAGYEADPGHTVSVLMGKADGTFRPQVQYDVGYQPFAITAADLSGDGKIDLATANWADGTVSVLSNKGNGSFRPATTYAAGYPGGTYGIAAVQFDAGSKPGLVVATLDGTYVFVNKGDGTLRDAQVYEPVPPGDFVGTDLNGDGKADLIIAGSDTPASGPVKILFGMGQGRFASSTTVPTLPDLTVVAEGDFNGDGLTDLAVADDNSDQSQLFILLGRGNGRFSAPVGYYDLPGYPAAIAVGDLNGDGKLDLAVLTRGYPDKVQVLMGKGDGSFTVGGAYPVAGSYGGVGWIGLADFNDDGVLDLAVPESGVNILLGKGDGSFKQPTVYSPGTNGLAIGDFNGDGELDFAVATLSLNTVSVYLGKGDGTFKPAINHRVTAPEDLAAADFNQDGKLDLAVLRHGNDVEILLGNGNGSFRRGSLAGVWVDALGVSAADFNGDGNTDLVVGSSEQGLLYMLSGKGDGTFAPAVSSFTGEGSQKAVVGDLNADGALDVVVPNYAGGVSVLLNHCPP